MPTDNTAIPPDMLSEPSLGPSPRPCRNCRVPRKQLDEGRCPACAAYWHAYGIERPPHLWGRPATECPDRTI
jgi:hypothetical protein